MKLAIILYVNSAYFLGSGAPGDVPPGFDTTDIRSDRLLEDIRSREPIPDIRSRDPIPDYTRPPGMFFTAEIQSCHY